jgi:glutamate dehydrogenase
MQVHLTAYAADTLNEVSTSELQAAVRELARTWDDRVREQLAALHGDERGRMLAARWAKRLPEQYKAFVAPAMGAADIGHLERLATGGADLVVGLANGTADPPRTRVSLYKRGPKVELGRATPLLEHLGLRAIEELPTRLEGEPELWVQSFAVLGPGDVRWTSMRAASACLMRWAPRGGASPSRIRSTASWSRRTSPGARSRSCAPIAVTASGSARATRSPSRTTSLRPTRG